MNRFIRVWVALLSVGVVSVTGDRLDAQSISHSTTKARAADVKDSTAGVRSVLAFVADEHLAALRQKPELKSTVVRRLRLGRKVWIISRRNATLQQPHFCHVATSRRTSGWIHAASLIVPSRRGEDRRLLEMIAESTDGLERLTRCQLFLRFMPHSILVPKVLLAQGEEAERASSVLGIRSTRRIARADTQKYGASERDYFLTDPGLDRYSRIGVSFDFNGANNQYVYDGRAYREILARFPKSDAAVAARTRLEKLNAQLRRSD